MPKPSTPKKVFEKVRAVQKRQIVAVNVALPAAELLQYGETEFAALAKALDSLSVAIATQEEAEETPPAT